MKLAPLLAITMALTTIPAFAADMPVCSGADRAARKLTCVVDGDTGWQEGRKWRMLEIDTPEISHPECEAEDAAGMRARDRLRELMADGYEIEQSGRQDRSKRDLVRVRLADGSDAGERLISDRLAQVWPNKGNVWCGRP